MMRKSWIGVLLAATMVCGSCLTSYGAFEVPLTQGAETGIGQMETDEVDKYDAGHEPSLEIATASNADALFAKDAKGVIKYKEEDVAAFRKILDTHPELRELVDYNDPETWEDSGLVVWTGFSNHSSLTTKYITELKLQNLKDSVEVSGLSQLEVLNIKDNNLETIKLSNLPRLYTLFLGDNNNLSELELSAIPLISSLTLSGMNLSKLKLSDMPNFTSLYCDNNNLSELDLSGVPRLGILDCKENNISKLKLSDVPDLTALNCSNNNIKELDLTGVPNLKNLSCNKSNISKLILPTTAMPNLEFLSCMDNNLTSLELPATPKLTYVNLHYNNISKLDMSGAPNLENLYCLDNGLETLNISGLEHLISLKVTRGDIFAGYNLNQITTFTSVGGKTLTIKAEDGGRAEMYDYDLDGDQVYVKSETYYGYKFKGWLSSLNSVNNTEYLNFKLEQDTELTATFMKKDAPAGDGNGGNNESGGSDDGSGGSDGGSSGGSGGSGGSSGGSGGSSGGSGGNSGGSGGSSSGRGGGSSSSAKKDTETYLVGANGHWKSLDTEPHKWSFVKSDGNYISGRWARLTDTVGGVTNTYWYYFAPDGFMADGWFKDGNGKWYYLSTKHDGWFGHAVTGWFFDESSNRWYYMDDTGAMVTGWRTIDGKSYYFHESYAAKAGDKPYGSMYAGEKTPDGYTVDRNGVWVQ